MKDRHRSKRAVRALPVLTLLLALLVPMSRVSAQDGPSPSVEQAIDALLGMVQSSGDASLEAYAQARLTDEYRAELSDVGVLEHLRRVREESRETVGDVRLERDEIGIVLGLSAQRSVRLRLVLNDEGRASRLEVMETADRAAESAGGPGAPGGRAGGPDGPVGGPDAAAEQHVLTIEGLASGSVPDFVDGHFSPGLAEQLSGQPLDTMMSQIRRAVASAGAVMIARTEAGYAAQFREGILDLDVHFTIADEAPYLIETIRIDTEVQSDRPRGTPVFWETLSDRLREVEASGLSGTVLAIRDGQTVLSESYGSADRAAGRPNTPETIFDIGSIPIAFTRAAILLLLQREALDLDDPLTRFFEDVPVDKQGMTLRHLLTNRSGLPNFHHRVGTDADFDLSWIDRDTAEERIFDAPLLFAPGEDDAPSHSGFVLLAAVVERVSGEPYGDFLHTNFFAPLGMTRTGMYGVDLGFTREQFATGYGQSSVGDPNIPPNWGPTSWLIMGSGGMVSNPADLQLWFTGLRGGRILRGEPLDLYLSRRSAAGGTDRGFLFIHAWGGGDSMIFAAFNAGMDSPSVRDLTRALVGLVASDDGG